MVTCSPPLSPSCWRTRACLGRVPWSWPTTCCSLELPSSWDTSAGVACTSGRSTGPHWSTAGASVTGWLSWSIRGSCRSCRGANRTCRNTPLLDTFAGFRMANLHFRWKSHQSWNIFWQHGRSRQTANKNQYIKGKGFPKCNSQTYKEMERI